MTRINKKGAEMSINVIIVAILALVVLAVLIFIFAGRSQIFSKSVSQTCKDQGGICPVIITPGAQPCAEGTYLAYAKCTAYSKLSSEPCCLPFK